MISIQEPERLFCPRCGKSGVRDTGDGDYLCVDKNCPVDKTHPFISPMRERKIMADELVRLTLENEWLSMALRKALST